MVFLFLDMQKFLEQYVDYYLSNRETIRDDHLIILPSKRAVSALKNAFAVQPQSLWLPQIIDVVSFIENISQLNILEHNDTVLEFYKVYQNTHQDKDVDAFENFYSWASVLVADFNEIDRFLVNPEDFFEYRKALKEVDYFGEEKTEIVKSYIQFWEDMPVYYNSFKNHLLKNNMAYQGLAYRQAAINIEQYLKSNSRSMSFIGFNALNAAEEFIIESCLKQRQTNIGWDIDTSYLEEKQHPSNTFIKKYQEKWKAYSGFFIELHSDGYKNEKDIQIRSSPKNVGQAKSVAEVLNNMTKTEIEQTAIVLNDEHLLHPILNSIPKHIEQVNITMGLPLLQSPLTDFFASLIKHHKSGKDSLDYNFLSKLFDHNILNSPEFLDKYDILQYLKTNNLKHTRLEDILSFKAYTPELLLVINGLKTGLKPEEFIAHVVQLINMFLGLKHSLFKQHLIAFRNVFLELEDTFKSHSHLSFTALNIIFNEKLDSEKLSFKGSKLKGLQIMGMLETRLLDFDNIIITSVNEGILPSGKTDNSYIPYSLKKEFGLPTHTEKDAIYAYHFFRLLQRAKKCYLIYDNDQSGFNKGEQSRFITYLEVFKSPKHQLTKQQFSLSTTLKSKDFIEIEKTPEIISDINNLAQIGFSPTALTTYILNPILFYKRYVLKVKETEELEEVISHRDFGSLIHNTLEKMYENIGNLDEKKIREFKSKTDKLLKATFDDIYAKGDYETGANRIQLEIAKAYLDKFFGKELENIKKSKTEILSIEEALSTSLKTSKNTAILKGKIDRVDKHGEDFRIIDLKTGKVEIKDLKFDDFEVLTSDYGYSKAFQVLFYALVYSKKHHISNISAGIISFKNLNAWYMPLQYCDNNHINQEVLMTFEEFLSSLIDEILDPDIPFTEKEVNFGT